MAIAWITILPLTYSSSIKYPSGAGKILNSWIGNWYNESVYNIAIVIYMVPDILAALFFLLPQLQNVMERSNSRVLVLLMWWIQVSHSYLSLHSCLKHWVSLVLTQCFATCSQDCMLDVGCTKIYCRSLSKCFIFIKYCFSLPLTKFKWNQQVCLLLGCAAHLQACVQFLCWGMLRHTLSSISVIEKYIFRFGALLL